jgi:hypothetical protein
MNKNDLQRYIAETAYNVGYGAKKHFATYEITDKLPSVIGFFSIAVGVGSLFIEVLARNWMTAAFVVLGVLSLCIAHHDHKKDGCAERGKKLTQVFNGLKRLYFEVKSAPDADLPRLQKDLETLELESNQIGSSDQILFSGWFAHYKFFWEQQIGWIDEQLHFRFWRDKIPLSLILFFIAFFVVGFGLLVAGADAT